MKLPPSLSARRQFIRRMSGIAALVALPAVSVAASSKQIQSIRMAEASRRTRVVLDLDGPVKHSVFTLGMPDRVVVDIKNARVAARLPKARKANGLLKKIRSAPRNSGQSVRVVLEVNQAVTVKSFALPPDAGKSHRLVIDIKAAGKQPVVAAAKTQKQPSAPMKAKKQPKLRDLVIAIDAGHGGRDPGAVGSQRTREKDITLKVARKLETMLRNEPGFKPVMIRNKDTYVGLRDRVKKARKQKADLFISIHADAFRDKRARGSSVFAVSLNGASSEAAQWLANRENSSDLFGDVSLKDHSQSVAKVLMDLAQNATIQSSLDVGEKVLGNLKSIGKVHKQGVEQAGFAVLKSPDIPSILVETAFISNPSEERKLNSSAYQKKLAKAMHKGILGYFEHRAPPGTVLSGIPLSGQA